MTQKETDCLSSVYAARGYIVIARHKRNGPVEIGTVIEDTRFRGTTFLGQPVRVIAETTQQDFLDQLACIDACLGCSTPIGPDYDKFYRVESD